MGLLRRIFSTIPGHATDSQGRAPFPDGHFYSPIVNVDEAYLGRARIWPTHPEPLGIDFNEDLHQRILREEFPRYLREYDYPELATNDPAKFHTRNSQFSWLDSRALFVLLRTWKPSRVIEVGSGFSSLLMADVNERFCGGKMQVTCIEPYPRPFLRRGVAGISSLVERKVQDVGLEHFAALEAGDVLFIDSSHVSKTGSDVNYLYLEVLPRLKSGVRILVHDIFLPFDYPQDWVFQERRSWNEQYLLQALLMFSTRFSVLFGCSYAFHRFPALVKQALALPDGAAFGGGSFWFQSQ